MSGMKRFAAMMLGAMAMLLMAAPAQATQYSLAASNPAPGTSDERAYAYTYFNGINYVSDISFERGGPAQPARANANVADGPLVPTSSTLSNSGTTLYITQDINGYTEYGARNTLSNMPQNTYYYGLVSQPATVSAATFASSNLTVPSPMVPEILDTAVPYTSTRAVVNYDMSGTVVQGQWLETSTITVDDNAGAMHDLSNPAHPDYDANLAASWDPANGGAGLAVLQGLLAVHVQIQMTDVNNVTTTVSDVTDYFKPGVGRVCSVDNQVGGMTSSLQSYRIGASSGSAAGVTRVQVQLVDGGGAALPGGVYYEAPQFDANGAPVFDQWGQQQISYRGTSYLEDAPGIHTLYVGSGDLVNLNSKATGFVEQSYPYQDLVAQSQALGGGAVPFAQSRAAVPVAISVTDAIGQPITGASISAYSLSGVAAQKLSGFGLSDSNGALTLELDPSIGYGFSAYAPAPYSYGSLVSTPAANGVNISGDYTVTPAKLFPVPGATIAMVMGKQGMITGTLVDTAGNPVAGATVALFDNTNNMYNDQAVTDASGNYTIYNSSPSSTLWLEVFDSTNLPAGNMGGRYGTAGTLTRTAGQEMTFQLPADAVVNINMQLLAGATISGVVTDPAGNPVTNLGINAWDSTQFSGGYALTDASGAYSMTVAAGTYQVYTDQGLYDFNTGMPVPFSNGWVGGYANGMGGVTPDPLMGASFVASVGTPTPVSMQLMQGGIIIGTLTGPGGNPAANVAVDIEDTTGAYLTTVYTDANGVATGSMVPAMPFLVHVDPWNANPYGYSGGYIDAAGNLVPTMAGAASFTVMPGATTTINAAMNPGAGISGVVVDPTGAAVVGATVSITGTSVYDPMTGTYSTPASYFVTTDATGSYKLPNLAPDTYTMTISEAMNPLTGVNTPFANFGVAGQVDINGTTGGAMPASITVNANQQALMNVQLAQGGSISGTLLDPTGAPVAGAMVSTAMGSVFTDATGAFTANMLPGSYMVNVDYNVWFPTMGMLPNDGLGGTVDNTGVTARYSTNALNVMVAAGVASSGNTISLRKGGRIDVTVLDPSGKPVPNQPVYLSDNMGMPITDMGNPVPNSNVATDRNGVATMLVDDKVGGVIAVVPNMMTSPYAGGYVAGGPGAYTLVADPSFAPMYAASVAAPTAMTVHLWQGATVDGYITDPNGQPVEGVTVRTNPTSMFGSYSATTDINGRYVISGITPGAAQLFVAAERSEPGMGYPQAIPGMTGGYADGVGGVVSAQAQAAGYNLLDNTTTTVNMQLQPAAAIQVTMTDGLGNPQMVTVYLMDANGTQVAVGTTNNAGLITFNVPTAGTYHVMTPNNYMPTVPSGYYTDGGTYNANIAVAADFNLTVGNVTSVSMKTLSSATDSDGDGVFDDVDAFPFDPNYSADTDLDKMPDGWETLYFGNLTTANATTDFNGNGVLDYQEYLNGTNPTLMPMQTPLSIIGTDANGTPSVSMVDAATGTVTSTINYFNNTTTLVAGLPIDIDGDGVNEYAIVGQRSDNLIMCQVRRADGTLVKAFYVNNATKVSVLNVYAAQMDAVAGQELVVGTIRLSDNRPVATVYNPTSGAVNMQTYMLNGNFTSGKFFPMDVNGDGIEEIALGGVKANAGAPTGIVAGRPMVEIRQANGTLSGYVFVLTKNYTNIQFARIDSNGDGIDEVAVMATNANNRLTTAVYDTAGSNLSVNQVLDSTVNTVKLMAGEMDGSTGEEIVLGEQLISDGRAIFDIRDSVSGARKFRTFMPTTLTVNQYGLVDANNDGVLDSMVHGVDGTGISTYVAKDKANTAILNGTPVGMTLTGDTMAIGK